MKEEAENLDLGEILLREKNRFFRRQKFLKGFVEHLIRFTSSSDSLEQLRGLREGWKRSNNSAFFRMM